MVSPFMPDEAKLDAVREGLPATGAGIYLNTGSAGPLPREVAAAMADLEQWELATGRSHPAYWEEADVRRAEARAAVAAVIHADLDAVSLTHGATDAVNAALWSIDWRPGDTLVTTDLEYPGVMAGIASLCRRRGLDLRIVGATADEELTLAGFEQALDGARMAVLSHVTWATGRRLPVEAVVNRARAAGALVCVDGAQSVGALPIDVEDMAVDFLAIPAQKWLLGPEGMGALYVSPHILDRVAPGYAGAMGLVDPLDGQGALRPGARAFESSNFHSPSVVGVARACGWMSMYVGLDWITSRATGLARGALDLLAATPGVEVLTPPERMAALVTFRIARWGAQEALDELARRTHAIARVVAPLDAIRISVGFFNTEAEIARFCDAVAEVARHTPATLPRRPALTILGEA